MSNLSNEQEILLKEYQEACENCRDHGRLVRTGFTIFTALQAAIIGFLSRYSETGSLEKVLLEVFGFWLSVIVCITYSVLSVRPEALRIKQVELSHRNEYKVIVWGL